MEVCILWRRLSIELTAAVLRPHAGCTALEGPFAFMRCCELCSINFEIISAPRREGA